MSWLFQRASTVQFNFLSFDELVPFLPKFRWENWLISNLNDFAQGKLSQRGALWIFWDQLAQHEPVECPCSGGLNMVTLFYSLVSSTVIACSQVQGITSLTISEEGNPLYAKNWRPYAIFRSLLGKPWYKKTVTKKVTLTLATLRHLQVAFSLSWWYS